MPADAGPARGLAAGAIAVLLCGCAESPPEQAIEQAARPTPEPAAEAMSYEVAIAIAAANRNRGLERCDAGPPALRRRCRAEIQSDWDVARAALADLRGDQG